MVSSAVLVPVCLARCPFCKAWTCYTGFLGVPLGRLLGCARVLLNFLPRFVLGVPLGRLLRLQIIVCGVRKNEKACAHTCHASR
eukprot:4443970-Alexandrium_andersonii.AAC.1